MNNDCIFCKIANKEIPSSIVFEDNNFIAFKDISPKAPVHIVFIPKKHIPTLNDLEDDDAKLLGELMSKITDIARTSGINESGYRVVLNCNKDAGQEVFHIHAHLLGGRHFGWPPG